LKVGIVYHEKFSQYDLGPNHPFRGDRFINAKRFFEDKRVFQSPNVSILRPEAAKHEDLLKVHSKDYVDLIFRLAEMNAPYDRDTSVSQKIVNALMLIIGGAMEAGTAIYEEGLNRSVLLGGGFHHAGRDYGGGFCLFNDIAILVEHIRANYGLKQILILDYDVHFGNGTSDIYYSDPSVLFISLHQDPMTIYPGTGFIEQIGEGEGEGYNVNVPLPPETGEQTYLYALMEIFLPLAEEFKPEIIIANGGSDAYFADSLGRLGLTVKGFFELSKTIVKAAQKLCNGRIVLILGSGYNPTALPYCWYALVGGVIGLETVDIEEPYPPPEDPWRNRQIADETLRELKEILGKYWNCF